MTLVRRITTATAAMTLVLVAIGGLVRATGSGDACPDWPRCFGSWLPPFEANALIEYSHRAAAALVGVLIFATAWVVWRRARRDAAVFWTGVAALPVVLLQAWLGRQRIEVGPDALLVTIHLLTAMSLVALVVVTAAAVRVPPTASADAPSRGFRALVWWTLGGTALLLLLGAYVRGEGASLVFLDWPLMDGELVPDVASRDALAHFSHRLAALVVVALGGVLAVRSLREPNGAVRVLAWGAFALLLAQAGIGAAAVLTRLSTAAVAGHVAGSALAWATLLALATVTQRLAPSRPAPGASGRPTARERVVAYAQLTKPDIIVLLLITTVPAMILAAEGMPPWSLVLATLGGGALAAAGANAINCYLDRDIDEAMARTRARPLPSHRVAPEAALRFGLTLVVVSFAWLLLAVNLVAAALTLSAAAFYVVVYTLWMKRSTSQNIVIGGAAGAVPALVGWAAVTGGVSLPAWMMFTVVFVWTPPHFWALALKYAGDYRAAGVPMLPVVRGRRATAVQIVVYAVAVVTASLALHVAAGLGPIYLTAALALGAGFVLHAIRVLRGRDPHAPMALFHFSITYLALLFAAAAADQLARAAGWL